MPRQKKDVWYSFKEIIVGGVKRAKCKTCGFEVVNNAARMEKHMRDCRNVDDDDDIQEQSTSSATTTSSAPPAPKKRQTALNVISTNPTRQHESDILVTRYFIATNTPFNAASNKHSGLRWTICRKILALCRKHSSSGKMLPDKHQFSMQVPSLSEFSRPFYPSS